MQTEVNSTSYNFFTLPLSIMSSEAFKHLKFTIQPSLHLSIWGNFSDEIFFSQITKFFSDFPLHVSEVFFIFYPCQVEYFSGELPFTYNWVVYSFASYLQSGKKNFNHVKLRRFLTRFCIDIWVSFLSPTIDLHDNVADNKIQGV